MSLWLVLFVVHIISNIKKYDSNARSKTIIVRTKNITLKKLKMFIKRRKKTKTVHLKIRKENVYGVFTKKERAYFRRLGGSIRTKLLKKRLATMVESGNYHSKYQVLSATVS